MPEKLDGTLVDPSQIKPTKIGYDNLYEQLEYGRFNSVHSGASPTMYQEMVAEAQQSLFVIPHGTYVIGDYSLQVFVNGQLMRVGVDNDYTEIDNKTIQFTFGLDAGDVVVVRVNGGKSGPSLYEHYKALNNQKVFNLVTSYTSGNNSLVVFVNGAYQTVDVDYTETDGKTVTFIDPLELDDLVIFRVEGLPSTQTQYGETTTTRLYNNSNELLVEEQVGNGIHVVKEYQRDADGKPAKMIIRQGGHIITRTYTWDEFKCTGIHEEVREGS